MVRTESKDVEVGSFRLPAFTLPEPSTGQDLASVPAAGAAATAAATVVIFYAPHCPFVKLLKEALTDFAAAYAPRGVRILAVCSSSQETHPQDGPDALKAEAAAMPGIHFLFDGDQAVAKAFMAACTPEFYVFDADGLLAYHGQACDARPKQDPPAVATAADLRAAVDDVLAGRLPVLGGRPQKRALGCNIKFTPGNEPDYFRTTF
jgi:thiol-disulfide isomerase/thioredoxin